MLKKILLKWALLIVSFVGASYLTQHFGYGFKVDISSMESFGRLAIGAIIFALINTSLGRILKIVALPFNILTLGIASILINGWMLILASRFEYGFVTEGFIAALLGAFCVNLINKVLGVMVFGKT